MSNAEHSYKKTTTKAQVQKMTKYITLLEYSDVIKFREKPEKMCV